MSAIDIPFLNLAFVYLLLIIPVSIILWLKIKILDKVVIGVLRMTVQLLFVGFYLQFVFDLNKFWLTAGWMLVMIFVADVSITRGCGLRFKRFAVPLFVSIVIGAAIPLFFFMIVLLRRPNILDAQFAIPISGMIIGNCLRANIIGMKNYYQRLKREKKAYQHSLAQGATRVEAGKPFLREALNSALAPTLASIATIGLVALPGMMTGVMLGGANPMTAIKYQIAIMISIFTGTTLSTTLSLTLTSRTAFDRFGNLCQNIFK